MDLAAIRKIETWASGKSGPRADFARQVAEMLKDERKRPTLSLLDIRREFESRPNSSRSRWFSNLLSVSRAFLGGLYLAPVAFTWLELRNVLGEFAEDKSLREGVSLISYWTGQAGDYTGNSLQTVGMWIAVFVAILLAAQILLDLPSDAEDEISAELNQAIFEVQFDLAQTRVLTPQEFTKTISAAANELELALDIKTCISFML